MTRKQTRRCVSFSGELYDALRDHCARSGQTMSGVVENELRRFLKMGGKEEKPVRLELIKKTAESQKSSSEEIEVPKTPRNGGSVVEIKRDPGNIFTF